MSFQDLLARDVEACFLNPDHFAEEWTYASPDGDEEREVTLVEIGTMLDEQFTKEGLAIAGKTSVAVAATEVIEIDGTFTNGDDVWDVIGISSKDPTLVIYDLSKIEHKRIKKIQPEKTRRRW